MSVESIIHKKMFVVQIALGCDITDDKEIEEKLANITKEIITEMIDFGICEKFDLYEKTKNFGKKVNLLQYDIKHLSDRKCIETIQTSYTECIDVWTEL